MRCLPSGHIPKFVAQALSLFGFPELLSVLCVFALYCTCICTTTSVFLAFFRLHIVWQSTSSILQRWGTEICRYEWGWLGHGKINFRVSVILRWEIDGAAKASLWINKYVKIRAGPGRIAVQCREFFFFKGSVIVGDYVSIQASVDFGRNQTRVWGFPSMLWLVSTRICIHKRVYPFESQLTYLLHELANVSLTVAWSV